MRRPRPRSLADLDVVDVLLVDDDDDVAADEVRAVLHELALEAVAWRATWPGEPERLPGPGATVQPEAPHGPVHRIARRYRWRALAGAVLILAVVATSAVVDARQTAARARTLAATPTVLTQAGRPPAERWRLPGRVVSAHADVLLTVAGPSLRALDPATGRVTWTSEASGPAAWADGCFPVDDGLPPGPAPVDDRTVPHRLVACLATAPAAPAGSTATREAAGGARVVVLDTVTGRTTVSVTADGALLSAEPVDGDLLVAAARSDGTVRVTRWDPVGGTPRWDTVSRHPALTDGAEDAVERRAESLTVGTFAVDLRSGDELDAELETAKPYPTVKHTLPGGAQATWSWHEEGTSGRGRVWGGDAASSYMLPGAPLRPSLTDGSDDGVLLVRTARGWLRGLDLRSGRLEWSRPYPDAAALRATAVVDGVLLLDDGASVVALEVRTGDRLWRAPVESAATSGAALTDGEVVVLPTRADDGTLHLVARRFTDGTEVWRTTAPPDVESVAVVDHRLVAWTDDEVIGLG